MTEGKRTRSRCWDP